MVSAKNTGRNSIPSSCDRAGGGWQFLTKKDYHKTIAQLNGDKFLKRLSSAALETLAIIAYKQPVTKGEIEAIRGVSSDYAVQKLLEKELIIITGRNEKLPGHPLVYATSKNFMDYFGINSADDLPKIKEILADQLVEPTVMKDTVPMEEELPADESPAEASDVDNSTDAADNIASDDNDQDATDPSGAAAESVGEEENESSDELSAEQDGETGEEAAEGNEMMYSVSESGELVEKPGDEK